jgi:hypothetical protein
VLKILIACSFVKRSQLIDEVGVVEFETGVDEELTMEE